MTLATEIRERRKRKAEIIRSRLRRCYWHEEDRSQGGCTDIMFTHDGMNLFVGDDSILFQNKDGNSEFELTVMLENASFDTAYIYLWTNEHQVQVRIEL